MATQTFKGAELYSAITINSVKLAYRADSKLAGQYYYTGRWGARGFICSEEFAKDFKNGNISQLSIDESSYMAKDPATGQEVERQSATIMGYVTFDRQINIVEKLSKLDVAEAKADITKTHARVAAIAELGLNESDFSLMEKLTGLSMKELVKAS